MSSQDAFLARVRWALRKEPVPPSGRLPLVGEDQSLRQAAAALRERLTAQRQALIAQIQHELSAVGGRVACVASVAEATAYVTQLARDKNVTLVVRWPSELLHALEVDAALQQSGVSVRVAGWSADTLPSEAAPETLQARRQELRTLLAQADLGLSGVDAVIAETGTLALSTLPGQMRSVSLVPPVHVAVARTGQIVPTMADYLLRLRLTATDWQCQLTSCVSFITGPSRTGDIELKLTIGVHGPGELYLVLIDEPVSG
jgi:L-lactate dehydrogenase complex protein LldG